MPHKPMTARGFRIFHKDDELFVVEASIMGCGPHVRVYQSPGDDQLELSLGAARLAHAALGAFIAEAEAGELLELPDLR